MKKAALAVVLAGLFLGACSSNTPAATPSTSTTTPLPATTSTRAAVSATPTPKGIPTSGSYAADVAKLGIKPDNIQSYAMWMKERICEQDSVGLGIAVRSIGGSTVASGGGIEVVRLTNAYFCPNKTQEVEAALDYFDQ
ncbi:hypothetical protein [Pseudarthrobacter sp. NamE5]|uniref:hypothetical protein n=1 Tax=Pseudarthrobacter sp. NamE5 TaxID=2576839 RepID=UPI00110A711C|nr:hypothetical protein [Pseudarthrobacter sp. NamE5]TLM87192.1 hypothetical protein FDW84_05190 [Pseudarthrobacter sp. NamE5]